MMAALHRVTYEIDSCVRGFHIYQDIWTPVIGEELLCEREEGNRNDRYAVSVHDVSTVVGHVPRHISTICNVFLRRGGSISCIITRRRQYSRDLPQGGMEVPCKYRFVGSPKELSKVESCLHGQTYKGDENQRSMITPSEDVKKSLSVPAAVSIPTSQEKMPLRDAVQENSLPSSSITYNDDKKLSNLQTKPLSEMVVLEKILDDNDNDGDA